MSIDRLISVWDCLSREDICDLGSDRDITYDTRCEYLIIVIDLRCCHLWSDDTKIPPTPFIKGELLDIHDISSLLFSFSLGELGIVDGIENWCDFFYAIFCNRFIDLVRELRAGSEWLIMILKYPD